LAALCSAFAVSAGGAAEASRVAVEGEIQETSAPPPRPVVLRRSALDAPGYIFIAPKREAGAKQGPEIVDERGRPVWVDPIAGGEQASDFRVQSYLGKPVLTWSQGRALGGFSQGVDYIADSSYHVIATVHAGNGLQADGHEFLLTPQGTALITSYHGVSYDLSSLGGPKDGQVVEGVVQEIDVATGRVLFEWHSLDHVPLDESYAPVSADSTYDYFHVNAVSIDNDGNLLISGRHTWTVYKVDRHSGRIIWRLGGKHSDFKLGRGVRFAWQHNPLAAGTDTIRLFDNEDGDTGVVRPQSRVIWIRLNTTTMTATLEKVATHPGNLTVQAEGNAQALANGDTFVGWGQLGRVSEFNPHGRLLFDALLPPIYDTYRAYRQVWSGRPPSPPTASARTNSDGTTTVHAIWNGATAVARWRILAGPTATRLATVATIAWNGLSTPVKIRGSAQEVEVVALDARGRVIARTKPVRAH